LKTRVLPFAGSLGFSLTLVASISLFDTCNMATTNHYHGDKTLVSPEVGEVREVNKFLKHQMGSYSTKRVALGTKNHGSGLVLDI
jgi:hypothetical protein